MKIVRFLTAMCGGLILYMLALFSFGVTADLPAWRHLLGAVLLGGAACVWDSAWAGGGGDA